MTLPVPSTSAPQSSTPTYQVPSQIASRPQSELDQIAGALAVQEAMVAVRSVQVPSASYQVTVPASVVRLSEQPVASPSHSSGASG